METRIILAQAAAQSRRIFRSSPHQQNQQPEVKKSLLANPGSLLVGGFGILFVGYVFNVRGLGTGLDRYFNGLNRAAQGHQGAVASVFVRALPLVGAGVVILIAMAVLRWLGPSTRTMGHVKAQEARGIETFVAAAAEHGVSLKVARAAYRLLLPQVRKGKQLGVGDTLCSDLKVKPEQVSDLYGTLLRHTDRRRRQGDDGAKLLTVASLLMAVEASVDKSVPTATVLAFKVAAEAVTPTVAEAVEVSVPETMVAIVTQEKPKKASAVLVHPARLERRELSMIRSRSARARR